MTAKVTQVMLTDGAVIIATVTSIMVEVALTAKATQAMMTEGAVLIVAKPARIIYIMIGGGVKTVMTMRLRLTNGMTVMATKMVGVEVGVEMVAITGTATQMVGVDGTMAQTSNFAPEVP